MEWLITLGVLVGIAVLFGAVGDPLARHGLARTGHELRSPPRTSRNSSRVRRHPRGWNSPSTSGTSRSPTAPTCAANSTLTPSCRSVL